MAEIIPTINAPDWPTVKERIEKIAPYSDWVEIDVSDGRFAPTKTWANPDDLKTLETSKHVRIAIHLMVSQPEKEIDRWLKSGVRRIIVHYEALKRAGVGGLVGLDSVGKKIAALAEKCHSEWVELGLAIVWRTPVKAIARYLNLVDVVQVLAVEPGPSGQQFNAEALSRVNELRPLPGKFKIEWDGGVTLANVRKIKNAGADLIAAASAIFGSREPERALEALKRELLG